MTTAPRDQSIKFDQNKYRKRPSDRHNISIDIQHKARI